MADYTIRINAQDNASGKLDNVKKGLGGVAASAGRVKAAIGVAGAAIAAFGVAGQIQGTIDDFDSLAKAARSAGATASNEAFRGFQVMKQALNEAGVDASTADRAFLNISQRMKEGAQGGKGFAEVFEKLKGQITTTNGELKSSPEILQSMINALNDGTISADEFQKVVGGRAGPVIAQQFASLNTSAEALANTLSDVEANSNIVSLEAAENAEVFNDTVGRLKEAMGQLMTDAVTPLLPLLNDLANNLLANMPAIIEGVQTAFSSLEPVISLLGTVLTDLVFPIMQKVFEVLGNIASAIAPLVEASIPKLKEGFDFLAETTQALFDKMLPVFETALPLLNDGFTFVKDAVAAMYEKMKPVIDEALPMLNTGLTLVKDALGFMFDKMKVVYETAVPALNAGLEQVRAIIESLVSWINTIGEKLTYLKDKAIALKNGTVGAFNGMKEGVTNATSSMVDGVKAKADGLYQYLYGGSVFPDLRDGIVMTMEQMAMGVIQRFQGMAMGAIQNANSMVPGFTGVMSQLQGSALNGTQGIESAFQSMFGGLNSMFSSGLNSLLGKFSSFGGGISKIFGGLGSRLFGSSGLGGVLSKVGGGIGKAFGGIKSAFSGIVGGIGRAFGGLFGKRALGGQVRGGKPYVVGERGPEMFVPSTNGQINPSVGGGGGAVNVNFTIQAIDTQSAAQVISSNRKLITGIIEDAYNRRGRQGIY